MSKPQLGTGARFKGLAATLASKPGVTNPNALAAAIGRKKYGAKKFNSLSRKKYKGGVDVETGNG